MDKKKIEELVGEEVSRIVATTEIELVDVEFVREKDWYLRIFIDQVGGVGLDECQFVSRALDEWLEETDPIPQSYHLEVSSPGLDRPLKKETDFVRNKGNLLEFSFFAPWEGKKSWVAILEDFDEEKYVVNQEGNQMEFPRKMVSKVCLSIGM